MSAISCSILTAILIAAPATALDFGPERNLFSISGIEFSSQGADLPISSTRDIDFTLDVSQCQIFGTPLEGYSYLAVPGCVPSGESGRPQVPMKTLEVRLPHGARVCRLEVLSASCRQLEEKIRVVPNPQPVAWHVGSRERAVLVPDEEIYSQNRFFPGRLVSFDSGSDRRELVVYIRLFPVQYNPAQNTALVMDRVRLRLSYGFGRDTAVRGPGPKSDARDLIIAPPEFSSEAESLMVFHESVLGISSEAVTTTWIDSNYSEAPDPPYYGYANEQPPELSLYDYSLAKKIISCLRDTVTYPDLEWVTIFGDGIHVPPSYYARPRNMGGVYESWVPTDFLYSSPDYDYYPELRIGRLTANDSSQAQHMVDKAKAWYGSLDWSWFQNATIGGGRPFGSEFYYGELITDDAVNLGWFDDMARAKCFYTDNAFNRAHILPSLQDGQVGILYHIGHGDGQTMYLASDYITSWELQGFAPVSEVPVVVSVACDNGAFDTHIIGGGYLSFAEGVLLSEAGGIAYLGGSRTNSGVPSFYYDQGEVVIVLEHYMVGMLTDVFEAYQTVANDLGDLYADAIPLFLADHSMSDAMNRRAFFEFVLLGDPTLPIPARQPGTNYAQPDMTALDPLYFDPDDLPHYEEHLWVGTNAVTNSPSVTHKLIDTDLDQTLEVLLDPAPPFDYGFYPGSTSFYLVRSTGEDGKEGWLYLIADRYRAPGPPLLEDPGDTVDVGDYLVVWHPSTAPHGVAGYELQESEDYRLTFEDDLEGLTADNWSLNGFVISQARCHSSSHSLYSETGDNLTHTATTLERLEVPTAGVLSFWLWYDIEKDWDYGYVEVSLNGASWSTLDAYTGTDTIWTCKAYGLAPWVGDSIYVRFTYETDAFMHYEGMYVDDIVIDGGTWVSLSNSIADTTFGITGRPDGTYSYRVRAEDDSSYWGAWSNVEDITVELTGVAEHTSGAIPRSFALSQNYPNPIRQFTIINYQLPMPSHTTLRVYDAAGRLVRVLVKEEQEPGYYSIGWDRKDNGGGKVAAGVYFYRLQAGEFTSARKMAVFR